MSEYRKRRMQDFRAMFIKATLGTRAAAGYLRNRGRSVEPALALLSRGAV